MSFVIPEGCPACGRVRSYIQDSRVGYTCGATFTIDKKAESLIPGFACIKPVPLEVVVEAPEPPAPAAPAKEITIPGVHRTTIGGVVVKILESPLTLCFKQGEALIKFEGDDVGRMLAWCKEEGYK
jgi:hypothetical protein